MLNVKLIAKIYELKGMIESLTELVNEDEQYNYPMIDRLESKMSELVSLLDIEEQPQQKIIPFHQGAAQ
jgi:hypothetical protein